MLNNKGFSMIELLVVIAAMAILATVGAINLIDNVAKSRESTDVRTCESIKTCIATALASEEAYDDVTNWSTSKFKFYLAVDDDGKVIIDGLKSDTKYSKEMKETLNGLQEPKVAGKKSYLVKVDIKNQEIRDQNGVSNTFYYVFDVEVATDEHSFTEDREDLMLSE